MAEPFVSDPSFRLLHAIRIGGRVASGRLADVTGLTDEDVAIRREAERRAGTIVHHDGLVEGWALTPEGRSAHADLLAVDRAEAGRQAQVAAAYESFVARNEWFKQLCTEWQLAGRPRSCVQLLAAGHDRVDAVVGALADELVRFAPYARRFATALDRLRDGDDDAFARPLTGSYHDVWMQLHEDLLLTLGRYRGAADGY